MSYVVNWVMEHPKTSGAIAAGTYKERKKIVKFVEEHPVGVGACAYGACYAAAHPEQTSTIIKTVTEVAESAAAPASRCR